MTLCHHWSSIVKDTNNLYTEKEQVISKMDCDLLDINFHIDHIPWLQQYIGNKVKLACEPDKFKDHSTEDTGIDWLIVATYPGIIRIPLNSDFKNGNLMYQQREILNH